MVAYKRENLCLYTDLLAVGKEKYRGENIILCGHILAVGDKQTVRGRMWTRKQKD